MQASHPKYPVNGSFVPPTDAVELLTPAEAAAATKIPQKTLEAWRCQGCGPRYVKLGRAVRYRSADLLSWIEAGARSPLDAQRSDLPPAPRPTLTGRTSTKESNQ